MTDIVTEPLLFDLFYGNMSAVDAMKQQGNYKEPEPMPVDETTPEFRDIYIERVVCNGASRAMYFNGPCTSTACRRCPSPISMSPTASSPAAPEHRYASPRT